MYISNLYTYFNYNMILTMIIYLDDSLCNVFKLITKFQKEKSFNPIERSFY